MARQVDDDDLIYISATFSLSLIPTFKTFNHVPEWRHEESNELSCKQNIVCMFLLPHSEMHVA